MMLIKLGRIWQARLVVLQFFTKYLLDQLVQCGNFNSNKMAIMSGGCAKIAGYANVIKWFPEAYCALYIPEYDQIMIRGSRDRWTRTGDGQLCICRRDVPTAKTRIYQTRWRRAICAFDCISSEKEPILGIRGDITPHPEELSSSLPSKCSKILECWLRFTGHQAGDSFI